jgi:HEAT repeat protein
MVLLLSSGCAIFEPIAAAPGKLFSGLRGNNPGNSARKMEDSASADNRREAINELVERDFAKRPPYTLRYRQLAESDPDFTVRAVAIRALNRARDNGATPVFIKALDDDNELIRLEAAKALVNLPDRAAIPMLLKHLEPTHSTGVIERGQPVLREENKDVRIACADALKHYPTLDVARTLVTTLDNREFGVAWQARQSLRNLTKQDFHYNEAAWLEYLTGPTKPLG